MCDLGDFSGRALSFLRLIAPGFGHRRRRADAENLPAQWVRLRAAPRWQFRKVRPRHPGFGSSSLSGNRFRAMIAPNNSFNPNPLRSTNNMADKACHVVGSTTQVGLTQALGPTCRNS